MCALSAQAIDAAEAPGCSTARRQVPDLEPKLEEELNDVTQEIDYFVVMLHCVVGDESSPQLLRPLRAP